jgi:hypothetical protein
MFVNDLNLWFKVSRITYVVMKINSNETKRLREILSYTTTHRDASKLPIFCVP